MARTVRKGNQERRLATPNPDLVVIKTGDRYEKVQAGPNERESGVLARLAKVMTKPGTDRARVFSSTSGKPVYAYSNFLHAIRSLPVRIAA